MVLVRFAFLSGVPLLSELDEYADPDQHDHSDRGQQNQRDQVFKHDSSGNVPRQGSGNDTSTVSGHPPTVERPIHLLPDGYESVDRRPAGEPSKFSRAWLQAVLYREGANVRMGPPHPSDGSTVLRMMLKNLVALIGRCAMSLPS